MTHTDMDELYELYVLGALELELAYEIDSHVAEDCTHCLNEIHRAVHDTAELSVLADPVTPPAEVRARLLASITRSQERSTQVLPIKDGRRAFSWAIPLLAAACVAIVVLSFNSRRELRTVSSELTRVSYERDQLRAAVAILSRRETRTIQFTQRGNPAHGSVLVNRDGGLVLVGSNLPPLTADKTYELWAIPAKGNPVPAGLFRATAEGEFLHVAAQPVNVAQLAAVAVSVEPSAGSPAPTTKPILVVPLT